MSFKKIAAAMALLCFSMGGAFAQNNYAKQASNGQNEKSVPEAFSNTVTYLQFCVIGGTISCPATQSLGVRYTSATANTELVSIYRCSYGLSTPARAASPGYDLYYCGANSSLPGWTLFVLVEGDFSNSFAGTITAIYQP
ncbi:MAG: hypothetical protein V4858_27080 [Pseudomonadota bacterium]